ncbi:hypothetical protein C8R44DRAFT_649566 [Mycena epipterygia]|nr:hypothetical protein C8R44DRAFT_649566 [Mycena epipterygia]
MNPFAQGWPASYLPTHQSPSWDTRPSVYGALPYHAPDPILRSTESLLTFSFSSSHGTVLNAALVGSDGRTYFHVSTERSAPGRTLVTDSNGARVGLIMWSAQPTVGIDALGWTLRASQWLCLSSDRTSRTIVVGGKQFSWRPNGGCIEMISLDNYDTQLFARISKSANSTILQLTPMAVQSNLLQVIVLSAVLLMSGRSID